jgi:hypothetical protein
LTAATASLRWQTTDVFPLSARQVHLHPRFSHGLPMPTIAMMDLVVLFALIVIAVAGFGTVGFHDG